MSIVPYPATDIDHLLRTPMGPPDGWVQSPEDEASAREAWEQKFGDQPRPIRDARDLLIAIGDHLASIGLEPDLGGDELTFTFLGHVHRLTLEDLERRRPGPTAAEVSMLSAGIPVG